MEIFNYTLLRQPLTFKKASLNRRHLKSKQFNVYLSKPSSYIISTF